MCEKNYDIVNVTDNISIQNCSVRALIGNDCENQFVDNDILENVVDHDGYENISPNVSKISLSLGKMLLKLFAHYNVGETAINFITEELLTIVSDVDTSNLGLSECLKQLETSQKRKTFYTKHFFFFPRRNVHWNN